MKAELIETFAARRLAKLGEKELSREYLHKALEPGETIAFDANGSLLFLVDEPTYIEITSAGGSYGIGDTWQHEHSGNIEIKNTGARLMTVVFVQIIYSN